MVTILANRRPEDPAKAVLPTFLFINANHPAFEEARMPGFMICFGWWDFSVKICVLIKRKNP